MKLAIHASKWDSFSEDWIAYCWQNDIAHKLVDCYANDIIDQVKDCDALLWHYHHAIGKDVLFAKQLLFALEQAGVRVFPNFATSWHFDDKLGQKYLLEAIGAPLAPVSVFYDRSSALKWAGTTTYPKVFKLRGGAGSSNVKLVASRAQAVRLIEKAFGKGFPAYDRWGNLKEELRKRRKGLNTWIDLLKSIRRVFVSTKFARIKGPEIGYVMFQEYIPDNEYDIRVVTIGDRAFAIKRLVRDNDFRASGSGAILYAREEIDERCIEIAFTTTKALDAQCVAYDFVFTPEGQPLIVEISYGFAHRAYFECPGYWDRALNWHAARFNAADWIVQQAVRKMIKK